uniref:Uncharacterized protein n=1 Tax=Parascaris equorum TaxID=6256 RepID=A0A914RS48_PAREQ
MRSTNHHGISGAKGGVPVNVEFWIQDISSISERTNDFVVIINFRAVRDNWWRAFHTSAQRALPRGCYHCSNVDKQWSYFIVHFFEGWALCSMFLK